MDSEQLKYQEELSSAGYSILKKFKIVYYSIQMRVGKTIIAFLTCRKGGYKKVLMVTRKKAISSIESDYNKLFKKDFQFCCTNFEQIHNINFLPDIIIVDEAHSFGQFPKPAVRTKSLKDLAEGVPIIYLSGTPTPESYSQIFHQFWLSSFSPFKEYKSFYKWAADYVDVQNRYLGQIIVKDYSNARTSLIKPIIDHLFVSFTQQEAGFKQEVVESVHEVPLHLGIVKMINKLKEKRVYTFKDGTDLIAETEVKLMNKIHQLSSGTVIVNDDDARVLDYSKARFIQENYKGKKIAIYYKFSAEYAAILATFGFNRLTDDPMVFNQSDDLIFVSQIQSGREGVNLSTADVIIMYNIDYSATSYFQVRDRMQFKNRITPAELHWIFSDHGMERKVYQAVSNKKDYTLSYFKKDYLS